jgi:hypothetical protein
MTDELENKKTPENSNNAPTDDELEAITAQLEEEQKAKAAAEALLTEKDGRIAELEASLSQEQSDRELALADLAATREANAAAVARYLDAVKAANPTIPRDVITGDTIEDIDASLAQATAIAERVRARLENEVKGTKVPAGAPARTGIDIEGLSPREKIAIGVQQKQPPILSGQGGIS